MSQSVSVRYDHLHTILNNQFFIGLGITGQPFLPARSVSMSLWIRHVFLGFQYIRQRQIYGVVIETCVGCLSVLAVKYCRDLNVSSSKIKRYKNGMNCLVITSSSNYSRNVSLIKSRSINTKFGIGHNVPNEVQSENLHASSESAISVPLFWILYDV